MELKLLLADDDAKILLNCIGKVLQEVGPFDVDLAMTPKEVKAKIASAKFDFVLLDVSFSPGKREGLELIEVIKAKQPEANIIMLTSHSDSATIKKCMGLGVSEFLGKNNFYDLSEIRSKLTRSIERSNETKAQIEGGLQIAKSVGATFKSTAMKDIYSKIYAIRDEQRMHVLVTGETGVGKELIARAIANSESGKPFYPINSSCFGKDLLESELFGFEKGAFTGADKQKIGLFEMANDGVIFLDEVATLTLDHQAKLLRVLNSGEFYRLGGTKLLKTNARVIAATNEDLESMAKKGTFRLDLLQRLERHRFHIPPLRYRKEDISCIVNATIQNSGKPETEFGPNVMQILEDCDWPRNVRQLEDTILNAILSSDGKTLMLGDLPRQFFETCGFSSDKSDDKSKVQRVSSDYGTLLIDEAQKKFLSNYLLDKIYNMTKPLSV
ncbi:MAG: sigma-54 dependent transcriptional regulator, partial [Proteobacteria bacterium]|nr:sigma-54 dependent transcriptional regulator [Pseudomonadota bacterium]